MGDIKKSIQEVLTEVHGGNLISMNMGEKEAGKIKFKPVSSFKMTYDAPQNQLEPIYYWLLDFMADGGLEVEKITDNFMSSPGSGHFADMGQRVTKMQEEGMKIFGGLNQVIKSTLNLVYDLKEFKMRLKHYEDYRNSKDKRIREAAFLALKQVWLDNVDLPKRQDGSIHGLASKIGYTTVREAFMFAKTPEDVDKMSEGEEGVINEAVARIIKPRLKEFLDWIDYSEYELRKRFNIEKSYLKSQIATIKLYAGWVKPYLKAAEQLRQKGFDNHAALVNAFSTSMFQLTLLGKMKGGKSSRREYFPIIIVNFTYRGHLLKANQRGDYAPAVSGKVDMSFDAYVLNSEELEFIKKKLEKEDLKDALTIEGDYATEALEELEKDFREFLGDETIDKLLRKERLKDEKKSDDVNPFSAIYSLFTDKNPFTALKDLLTGNIKKTKKEITDVKDIKKDNWTEKQVRIEMASKAASKLFSIYDIYKKAHGMASSVSDFNNQGDLDTKEELAKGHFPTQLSEVFEWDWK